MYTCMYCIPSKLESRDCSSYSPWSNYWHDLELPLSSDFCSVSTMDQPHEPQLHDGSCTDHCHDICCAGDILPGKTIHKEPTLRHLLWKPRLWDVTRDNHWNILKNLGFMVSTWHPQHGINLALMWCWCISMWLWIEVGHPIFAEFSSLVRYIATIDQHGLNHKGYWAFIFTPTHTY